MSHTVQNVAAALALTVLALVGSARGARAQTPLLEVENSDATRVLQVSDDGGFVVKGAGDVGTIPAAGAGVRLMWYPKKAALRAGWVEGAEWDDNNVGLISVAMGYRTTANGEASTALGSGTTASGSASTTMGAETTAGGLYSVAMGVQTTAAGTAATAMGNGTKATANQSTAMGERTVADGPKATAMGSLTTASGNSATAMGNETRALGDNSLAMGASTGALGHQSVALGTSVSAGHGRFVFGDLSAGFLLAASDNSFSVRAFGGIALNTGANIGCDLPPGAGTWACTSSRLAKERFEEVDEESVLAKLATMPIQRWRYLGTRAAHVGPTAEDFYAAFGLGEGPRTISTVDADGIALLAAQAQARRTAALEDKNADLRDQLARAQVHNAGIRAQLAALRERVDQLAGPRPTPRGEGGR